MGRVWAGLRTQSDIAIEWLVGNDASVDDTSSIVAELAAKSDFPVTLIEASARVGKACMDNELVAAANGEFIIWCDSDDHLLPGALARLVEVWSQIPDGHKDGYLGVCARAETEDRVLGAAVERAQDDWQWNSLFSALGSDLVIFARTELVKRVRFKEVDFMIPETSVWNVVGIMRVKFIDAPLKRVHYNQPNALSFTGKMQYNRGRAHALGGNYQYVKDRLGMRGEFVRAVNFIRYCVHGDVSFSAAKSIWVGSSRSKLMLLLGSLPAIGLILRDQWRGVVEKTHIEFERNRKSARLSRKYWSGGC